VLQLERQTPDLPFIIAIIAHAIIVTAVIWDSYVAMPDGAAYLEEASKAESTIDIIMFANSAVGVVKAAATSAVVTKPLGKVPEFRIPDLPVGETTALQVKVSTASLADWAMPALPHRDTASSGEPDINKLADGPRFTPFSRPPSLKNEDVIVKFLTSRFPRGLRRAGGETRSIVWLLIDMKGQVFKVVLRDSSGRAEADSVAVAASYLMSFAPAEQAGRPIAVWVQQPVRFRVQDQY
jgi:TonB family protein